ncbi:OLC1v1034943C2 [Oldenlandia corymbosa var. corymbosa]|uniref:OLC1v1034943C2 n=1 Tax=Oldenlandia corymbosa var. corymbosa TaxID=529605 RepID=A0AAV1CRY1_OLDCO|nr:OLC1v1034943C2 [Oldenlandia corymbosa var. corymbosa]
MAEGRFFEPYHVPQQSRRDKLRVISSSSSSHNNQFPLQIQPCNSSAGLVSVFDPTLISSDLITCTSGPGLHHQNPDAKDEGSNLMGYNNIGGGLLIGASSSSSSATTNQLYMDPVSSVQLNPSPIQDISVGGNGNPFYYNPQTPSSLRFLEQSFHGGNEVMVFRPEPLSVGHPNNDHHTTNNSGCNNNKYGGQGLSLSLSSSHHSQVQQTSTLPLELNLHRYDSSSLYNSKVIGAFPGSGNNDGSNSNELLCSRSSVPLGPFTGYASILRGSGFLKPAQQLLEEICDVGRGVYAEKMVELTDDSVFLDPSLECFDGNDGNSRSCRNGVENENRKKKSRLISMLNEVYKRYKQYYQQMQAVISSFESVPGVRNAAPFASLALKAMSKHFRCLKEAITEQLHLMIESRGHIPNDKDRAPPGFENSGSGSHYPRAAQNSGVMEHHQPVWRPQRGLPERAVAVLRSWLFEHFLHPYPTDTDKILLAKQTGLSRNQVHTQHTEPSGISSFSLFIHFVFIEFSC